jgi:hypothetical protein
METMVAATARIQKTTLLRRLIDNYCAAMDAVAGPSMPHVAAARIEAQNRISKEEALAEFDNEPIMGLSSDERKKLREELEASLQDKLDRICAHNSGKDIWRGLRAPFVFAVVAFLLNIVGTLLDYTNLADPIAHVLYYAAWLAFLSIAAWASFNYTGQYPEVTKSMDEAADTLWQVGTKYGRQLLQHVAGGNGLAAASAAVSRTASNISRASSTAARTSGNAAAAESAAAAAAATELRRRNVATT